MIRSAKFVISDRVRSALASNKGVVALESTVITHGLPFPQNLETAKALENVVKKENCEPATIAILNGKVHVGLSDSQLEEVADTMDSVKVSRRDIAYTLEKNIVGGTTVAATTYLASLAGIRVFATGGIGGVHRGADQTFDISADLLELAQTPVTVVSAGVKSILDISKTVEFLETHSVNTIVYGEKNEFPGFFTRNSGCKGQFNTTDLEEVARIIEISKEMGLKAGTVLGCPIPQEFQADGKLIEDAIQEALRLAKEKNIKAQQVTPFILKTVNELTKGASMKTNIALLKNNAKIGAKLANILTRSEGKQRSPVLSSPRTGKSGKKGPKVTVIGATIVDLEIISKKEVKKDGGSYEGITLQRCGGVGRNHADALTRLGVDVTLISAMGKDSHSKFVRDKCSHMDLSRVKQFDTIPTASYCAINVKGDIIFGINSIGPIIDEISPQMLIHNEDVFKNSEYLVLDGNISIETIVKAMDLARKYDVPVWFDPTDYHKAAKIMSCGKLKETEYVSPNANEFMVMLKWLGIEAPEDMQNYLKSVPQVHKYFKNLVITMADKGCVHSRRLKQLYTKCYLPPVDPSKIVSASGAGDCLNSGFIAGLLRGKSDEEAMELGRKAAACSLQSTEAVPDTLNEL